MSNSLKYNNNVARTIGGSQAIINDHGTGSNAVTYDGLYQGVLNCSANPNYPAATENMFWYVSVAGKIGGASGVIVEVGDVITCLTTNAGGTETAVGTLFHVQQTNITACTVAILRTGTSVIDFVTPKTLADAGFTFATTTLVALAGGTTSQLKLTTTAAQKGLEIASTVLTAGANPISISATVNSASVDMINIITSLTAGLTGGEILNGVAITYTGLASNADTSAMIGYSIGMGSVSSDRADYIGLIVSNSSIRDTADTDNGVYAVFTGTLNNAGATTYGLRVGNPTMTHTSGVFYGVYVNNTAVVAAGTSHGVRVDQTLYNTLTRGLYINTDTSVATATVLTAGTIALSLTGASASNMVEAFSSVVTTAVQMGTWANAIIGKIDLTTTGYVTGTVGAICAEVDMPSTNPAGANGTYTCFEAELGMPNAYTSTVPVSFMRMSVWGIGGAAGVAYFDTYGSIFCIDGVTVNNGKVFHTNTHASTHGLRILIGGVAYDIMLSNAITP